MTGDDESFVCQAINAGSSKVCWLCGSTKGKFSLKLWPIYEAVCRKAGITPLDKWPQREARSPAPAPKARRKR